jgi:glycosyltransferase involved in cell wall biosynthesis
LRLKIAVFSRNFSSSAGGAERYAIAVVEGLSKSHEIHVFSQLRDHDFPNVRYRTVPRFLVRPRWINQLYFAAFTWWATRKGFDIVHSHENTWHGQIQTVHVLPVWYNHFAGVRGARRILRWTQAWTSPRLLTYLGLEAGRFRPQPGRRVVCVSQTLLHVMQKVFPDAATSLRVVPPGLSGVPGRVSERERVQARQALSLPAEGRCLLFVGRQFRKKGLPTLLEALKGLDRGFHLLAIGSVELEAEMIELVRSLQLDGRVRILGSLSEMELAYRAADCLVHPTLEDTYAMVVLEAMSHGVPVIVSCAAYCGISAELVDGVDALILSDPQSPAEVCAAVDRLFKDEALRERMVERGIAFAQARAWSEVVLSYEAILQEAVAAT